MGLQAEVTFSSGTPDWSVIAAAAERAGVPVTVVMIDNLPAFPNEIPTDGWSDIRVKTAHGMISVKRTERGLALVVWGHAGPDLIAERDSWATALGNP